MSTDPGALFALRERGAGDEGSFREALGIEDGCCPSCEDDAEYGPLTFVYYRSDNGVWVEIETCCVHQAQIRDGLAAAGIEAK